MDFEELLALIDELDTEQVGWLRTFDIALALVLADLLTEVDRLIDRLELKGRATTAAEWAGNQRALMMFRAELPQVIERLGFRTLVNGLLANAGDGAGRLNSYYGGLVTAFQPATYEATVTALTNQVQTVMLTTLDAQLVRTVGDVLNWHVLTRSTASELRAVLREQLSRDGLAYKAISTTASDALYGFSRGYSMSVAEGLDLKHYFYAGVQIATSRKFCIDRIGKAYTQAEVESWANLSWSGKIPGTTRTTIFWYCGGYHCYHRLLPVSKKMYEYLKSKQ